MSDDVPITWKIRWAREQVSSGQAMLAMVRRHYPDQIEKAEARLRTAESVLSDYQAQQIEHGLQGNRRAANG